MAENCRSDHEFFENVTNHKEYYQSDIDIRSSPNNASRINKVAQERPLKLLTSLKSVEGITVKKMTSTLMVERPRLNYPQGKTDLPIDDIDELLFDNDQNEGSNCGGPRIPSIKTDGNLKAPNSDSTRLTSLLPNAGLKDASRVGDNVKRSRDSISNMHNSGPLSGEQPTTLSQLLEEKIHSPIELGIESFARLQCSHSDKIDARKPILKYTYRGISASPPLPKKDQQSVYHATSPTILSSSPGKKKVKFSRNMVVFEFEDF